MFHVIGYFACLREPRIFDLWITKVSKCPRVNELEALGLQHLRGLRRLMNVTKWIRSRSVERQGSARPATAYPMRG